MNNFKSIYRGLQRNTYQENLMVRGVIKLGNECNIHISSETEEFYIKYNELECSYLFGNLGNLLIHRNIVVKELTNENIDKDNNILNKVSLLFNSKKGGVYKIFNFYSNDELVLSLYFPYEEDDYRYSIITYDDIC